MLLVGLFVVTQLVSGSRGIFLKSLLDGLYEAEKCEAGGVCQLSMTCWMHGGASSGDYCEGSYIYVCCRYNATHNPAANGGKGERESQRYAQPRKLDYWEDVEANSVEMLHDMSFGPVRNDPACGLQRISRRRIVGGASAGFGTYPWQALITNQKSRCGGALVDRSHVVTAGHCVSNYTDHRLTPVGIYAYLGEYALYSTSEPLPMQKYVVTKVFVHPYYRFTPQADRYDVAVLRLDRPVKYAPHILPICLPMKNELVREDTEAIVSGWGARDPTSDLRPRNLQAVDVRVVDSRTCEEWHHHNNISLRLYEDMMCAGHKEGGKDACQGDSGGPLMTQRPDGRFLLIGIVSSGYSCAKERQPGIYHRVTKTSDWISYVTRFLRD